jgi:hypothetical protein
MPTLLDTANAPGTTARAIDASRWPLLIITFTGAATDREYEVFLEARTAHLARRERHAIILDGRACGPMPPSQRKLQADWQREYAELARRFTLGVAFLSASPIMRGVLTAILWMQPIASPYTVLSTWAEAERWTAERLRPGGVEAPPAAG